MVRSVHRRHVDGDGLDDVWRAGRGPDRSVRRLRTDSGRGRRPRQRFGRATPRRARHARRLRVSTSPTSTTTESRTASSARTGQGLIYVEYGPLTANVDLANDADATVDSTVDADFVTGRVIHAGVDLDGDGIGDVVTSLLADPKAKHAFSSASSSVSGPVSI